MPGNFGNVKTAKYETNHSRLIKANVVKYKESKKRMQDMINRKELRDRIN